MTVGSQLKKVLERSFFNISGHVIEASLELARELDVPQLG